MKFCQPHWDALRDAINARGLGDLIAPDGETVLAQMTAQLKSGESSPASFEPLMGAHWAIVNNVMGIVGLAVMFPDDAGNQRCPLCFVTAEHKAHCTEPDCHRENYDDWIDRAADDQLAAWLAIKDAA